MKRLFAAAALLAAFTHAVAGEITLFADSDFRGGRVTLQREARDLNGVGFNDRVSSIIVRSGVWQLCEHRDFGGRCAELGPGEYPSLPDFNDSVSSLREIDRGPGPGPGRWRDRDERAGGYRDDRGGRGGWGGGDAVQLFVDQGFRGASVAVARDEHSLENVGMNDRVSSIVIRAGRWEFCEHADFHGECIVLGPGEYGSLDRMNDRISSMRRVR